VLGGPAETVRDRFGNSHQPCADRGGPQRGEFLRRRRSRLGLLLSWHYALRAAGGTRVLTHPTAPVRRLLAVNHIKQLDVRGAPGH
jgi:hypothetical protein